MPCCAQIAAADQVFRVARVSCGSPGPATWWSAECLDRPELLAILRLPLLHARSQDNHLAAVLFQFVRLAGQYPRRLEAWNKTVYNLVQVALLAAVVLLIAYAQAERGTICKTAASVRRVIGPVVGKDARSHEGREHIHGWLVGRIIVPSNRNERQETVALSKTTRAPAPPSLARAWQKASTSSFWTSQFRTLFFRTGSLLTDPKPLP